MAEPLLVLLNGIPGSGKSTLARSWAERRSDPLALALDVDVLRSMLARWSEDALDAGLAARAMTIASIDVHLRSGHDVIVPQYLRRGDFIGQLDHAARAANARFVECALVVDPATATSRLASRAASAAVPGPEGDLEQSVEAIHEDFAHFLETRSDVTIVRGGTVADLEKSVRAALSKPGQ